MSILFDLPSQLGATFAGERRFSKSRGLSASVSFLILPLPLLHFLALVSFLARSKQKVPFLCFFCSETKRKRLLRRLTLESSQLISGRMHDYRHLLTIHFCADVFALYKFPYSFPNSFSGCQNELHVKSARGIKEITPSNKIFPYS